MTLAPVSVEESILEAVRTVIQGLALVGIPASHIQLGKIASDRENLLPGLPGILICPYGSHAPSPSEGTNLRDDMPYRVLVAFIAANNGGSQIDNRDRMFLWVEAVSNAFRHQRLSGVANVYTCIIENDQRFVPGMFKAGYDASILAMRFMTRE